MKETLLLSAHGNIGSGKSTLLDAVVALASRRITVIPEPIERWCAPYVHGTVGIGRGKMSMLEAFYEDKSGTAMAFQMYVLLTQRRWFLERSAAVVTPVLLMERGSWESVDPMSQLMFDEGYMTAVEWEVYKDWRREVQSSLGGLVYLRTPPERCITRILKRNRAEEAGMTIEYINKVHGVHERMLQEVQRVNPRLPVLVLDGTRDPVELAAEVVAWTDGLLSTIDGPGPRSDSGGDLRAPARPASGRCPCKP